MVENKLIKKQPFASKTAILCGGSQGMGKEIGKAIIQLGGSVCIIARTLNTLQDAAKEMKDLISGENQFVEIINCDTTDMDKLKPLLTEFINKHGVPDYLFNMVGYAIVQYIEKLTLSDFKKNMDTNYYGQLVPMLILLPYFMKEKKGYFINFSSMLGYFGIMGYATYAPSKFAIVGLVEAMRNELVPYNINFSIVYPPDVDTPGFEKENITKPEECAIISEGGGLLSAKDAADVIIKGVLKKKLNILPGRAKIIWRLFRIFPNLVRNVIDKDYLKARKQLGKSI